MNTPNLSVPYIASGDIEVIAFSVSFRGSFLAEATLIFAAKLSFLSVFLDLYMIIPTSFQTFVILWNVCTFAIICNYIERPRIEADLSIISSKCDSWIFRISVRSCWNLLHLIFREFANIAAKITRVSKIVRKRHSLCSIETEQTGTKWNEPERPARKLARRASSRSVGEWKRKSEKSCTVTKSLRRLPTTPFSNRGVGFSKLLWGDDRGLHLRILE